MITGIWYSFYFNNEFIGYIKALEITRNFGGFIDGKFHSVRMIEDDDDSDIYTGTINLKYYKLVKI